MNLSELQRLVGPPDYHMSRDINGRAALLLQYRLPNSQWLTIGLLDGAVVTVDDEETGRRVVASGQMATDTQPESQMTTTAVPNHVVDKDAIIYVIQGFSQATISSLQTPGGSVASAEIQQVLRTVLLGTMKSNGFKAIPYEDFASDKNPGVRFSRIVFVRSSALLLHGLIQLPIAMDEFRPESKSTTHVWSASITNVPPDFFLQNPSYLFERVLAFYGGPSSAFELKW
jgi:hypothetical protein